MADKTIIERLQPSLLDRLTDLAPESLTESRDDRVIDLRRLRDIIRRDMTWPGQARRVVALAEAAMAEHAAPSRRQSEFYAERRG
jgi:predicted component of type VI protein secretion system